MDTYLKEEPNAWSSKREVWKGLSMSSHQSRNIIGTMDISGKRKNKKFR
jgi:hypothetical protein